jgi:starch-binding outer membrane protein, SusD/RagB family
MTNQRLSTRELVTGVAMGVALLSSGACNAKETLLDAPIPTVIDPSAANSPAGADALRIGALSRLRGLTAGSTSGDSPWMFAGLITDEWKSSDTFSQRNETDQRSVQTNNANLTPILRDVYRTRTGAREAITSLQQWMPTPASNIGQMYFVMGIAELYLAEWFCNGTPLPDASTETPPPSPGLTNADVYKVSLAHFDSALANATATDNATLQVKYAAQIGKGRVLIEQGQFAAAAAAVTGVPTNYQLQATFSLTSGSNQIWSLGISAKRWTVGDSFDVTGTIKNALPFASAKDPRVPARGTTLGTSPLGRGFDGSTNLVVDSVFLRTDPAPIVSGIDARLIEAEAALKGNNDIAGMMAILNTLRTTPQSLGPATGYGNTPVMAALAAPATTADAVNLLFRERAFWTFSRGQRLGDLRRLIRLYGRAADGSDTFPTGPFFKGGTYGADVNFPVTVDEQNNPQWQQCIDRKA